MTNSNHYTFFNCVDFEVNFRCIWLDGNPPVKLQPGDSIDGPYDLLIGYNFLRPLYHRQVNPPIQNEIIEDINNQKALRDKYKTTFVNEVRSREDDHYLINEPNEIYEEYNELPFDPKNVNWVKVNIKDLTIAAEMLDIDLDEVKDLPHMKKKWAIVKLIKEKIN